MRFWTLLLAGLCGLSAATRAEVSEVRFAQQFSMGYLQYNVMKHQNLLEKHAALLGVPNLKVTWAVFNGPDMMNDALLSGSVDVVCGGVPGLLTLWAKTHGTANPVRGIAALSQQPVLLVTRNPAVKTIRDFGPGDRIALPAVKVSAQATLLQMAAAKEWGDAQYDRLDSLTFSLSPPDSTTGLLSGNAGFNSVFSVPPFQSLQLRDPAVHVVLDSHDITGPATGGNTWTSARFHDANPRVYQALIAALKEASAFIPGHERETLGYYAEDSKMKMDVAFLAQILEDKRYKYVLKPEAMMTWASFMHRTGRIKVMPASWKDLFWPEIHDMDGS